MLAIVLFSIIASSTPWLAADMFDTHGTAGHATTQAVTLSVFAMNFYAPSSVCMFMRFRNYRNSKNNSSVDLENNYRLRNVYSANHETVASRELKEEDRGLLPISTM